MHDTAPRRKNSPSPKSIDSGKYRLIEMLQFTDLYRTSNVRMSLKASYTKAAQQCYTGERRFASPVRTLLGTLQVVALWKASAMVVVLIA